MSSRTWDSLICNEQHHTTPIRNTNGSHRLPSPTWLAWHGEHRGDRRGQPLLEAQPIGSWGSVGGPVREWMLHGSQGLRLTGPPGRRGVQLLESSWLPGPGTDLDRVQQLD